MSVEPRELLKAGAALFDRFLAEELEPRIREAAVPELAEPMLYSLGSPGKRFRPLLVLLAAGCNPTTVPAETRLPAETSGAWRQASHAAAAVECIHAYSLIHDDLPAMDDDDLRRGRPACHVAFGEWAAILAGDALNTLAFELLARIDDASSPAALIRILSGAAGMGGMVSGQALDLAAEQGDRSHSAELLLQIHRQKTAALIAASCELGATVAECGPEEVAAIRVFGDRLGLLFQIADDLIDEEGQEHETGKRVGKDRGRGKLTYPSLCGLEGSRSRLSELRAEALDNLAAWRPGRLAGTDTRAELAGLVELAAGRSK